MTEYLLAVALLTSPPESAERLATHEAWAARETIRSVAVAWELMDPRESYTLSSYGSFAWDLRILQARYEDLRDAPPLSDAHRLPPREVLTDRMAFNRAFRESLDARLGADLVHRDAILEAASATDRLHSLYDAARDARAEFMYVGYRREALKRLREAMGPKAYHQGAWPDPVPRWAFTPAD